MLFSRMSPKSWLVLITISAVAAVFKPLGILFLLLFPFLPAFKITRLNYLVAMPIAVSLNVLTAIVNAVVLDTFNLPVNPFCIVLLAFVELVLVILITKQRVEINVNKPEMKYLYIIYGLFGLAVISRVVSVVDLFAPILHDPEAHAFWAKRIVEEKAIDYFYSPGLHIWTMLANQGLGLSLAKAVNLVTNVFSSLSVLTWPLSFYLITKNGRLAMWVAFFMLLAPVPTFLYFLAGKNALVMALSLISIVIYFAAILIKKYSALYFMCLLVSLLGIGLIHYPLFVYVLLAVNIYFFVSTLQKNRFRINKGLISHNVMLVGAFILTLITSAAILGNIYLTKHESAQLPITGIESSTAAFYKAEGIDPSLLQENRVGFSKGETTNPIGAISNLKSDYLGLIRSFPSFSGELITALYIASIVYFLLSLRYQKNYAQPVLSLFISVFIILSLLAIFTINGLKTTRDTGILILPFIFSLPCAWLAYSVTSRIKNVSLVVLFFSAIFGSALVYSTYKIKSDSAKVYDASDEATFSWINQNVPINSGFIVSSKLDKARQNVIFPTDGGLWLPIATSQKVSSPFHEHGFRAVESHVNYRYYKYLMSSDEEKITEAISYFASKDYGYVYIDGISKRKQYLESALRTQNLSEVIFHSGDVLVVQLKQP